MLGRVGALVMLVAALGCGGEAGRLADGGADGPYCGVDVEGATPEEVARCGQRGACGGTGPYVSTSGDRCTPCCGPPHLCNPCGGWWVVCRCPAGESLWSCGQTHCDYRPDSGPDAPSDASPDDGATDAGAD